MEFFPVAYIDNPKTYTRTFLIPSNNTNRHTVTSRHGAATVGDPTKLPQPIRDLANRLQAMVSRNNRQLKVVTGLMIMTGHVLNNEQNVILMEVTTLPQFNWNGRLMDAITKGITHITGRTNVKMMGASPSSAGTAHDRLLIAVATDFVKITN